jgi:uncharacterized membrane protein YccC
MPAWSVPAALRAVRATLVVPGLFALTYLVIGDLQLATFAAFGGFATLVLAAFGGTRRDQLLAHLGLALAGSALLTIGTVVSSSPVLAVVVTLPVVFLVLFAGVVGPNAAAGGLAALLAYVLPVASAGTVDMIPSRLAGWWMASVVGTAAVLLLSPRPPERRLRAAAATSARALADHLGAALRGERTAAHREASVAAKNALMNDFIATPYRPTGLSTMDQALANLVGLLEWCTSVLCESLREYDDLRSIPSVERDLLVATADTLRATADLLAGAPADPDLDLLHRRLEDSVVYLRGLGVVDEGYQDAVHLSFHARTVALATLRASADALVAARRSDPGIVADRVRDWYGAPAIGLTPVGVALGHASLRSVWYLNSVRGAIGLAAAVAVADLTGVEHGFWVVLGTLSVLRTNAASTGATALRALAGTVAGFAIGAALLLAIGTSPTALWVVLPIAVLVSAYAPGTAPFAVGQAAFTVTVCVLFNVLAPVGWTIGVVRLEDVALGCAISLAVGVLFWPRGAGGVVGDALADAFRGGGAYLAQAVDWALGVRHQTPQAEAALAAGLRLDDAMRGFLAEQGSKRVPKEDLWRLVGGTLRLRLTALSLAGLPSPDAEPDPASRALGDQAHRLAGWFERLAEHVGRPSGDTGLERPPRESLELAGSALSASPSNLACTLWVDQHLRHITPYLNGLVEPADFVARQRRAPWWR